ncbi:MAG: LacI family DNA-binding transcriptional regulator [Dermatophilaceae bacterium]
MAQLRSQVAWLIARGEVSEGERLPPIRDLATALGVNLNTVRAAYKRLEADGLVTTQRGRGTTVLSYQRARHLAGKPSTRSFTIGAIIPTHLEFYAPFLNALDSDSTDPSLLFICVAHQDPAKGSRYLDQLVAKNVDGIIVAGAMIPAEIATGINGQLPLVFADFPGAPGPSVLFNHEQGSALATAHMLEHGHRRIGFIAPPRDMPPAAPKYTGYERALAQAGLDARAELIETAPDFAVESGHRSALRLLTQDDPPTAIVAASDSLAIGTIRAARELAIPIPDKLALVGNDNIASASDTAPPLTTIDAPAAELGRRAIGMLEQLIAGQPLEHTTITLDTRLIVRQSCGCQPAP